MIKTRRVLGVDLPLEGLLECYNVLILEHAEHSHFSHNGLLRDFIIIRLLELFDANCNCKAKLIKEM